MASCPSMVVNLSSLLLLGAMSVLRCPLLTHGVTQIAITTTDGRHSKTFRAVPWVRAGLPSPTSKGTSTTSVTYRMLVLQETTMTSPTTSTPSLSRPSFNLNVTGRLDAPTLDLITSPRCGVPDVVAHVNSTATDDRRRSLYSYPPGRPVWPYNKRELSYMFVSPASAPVRGLFNRAFTRWSRVTPLSFWEIGRGNSDIRIAFAGIDGPGGTLANASWPTKGSMVVDLSENWRVQRGALSQYSPQYDLESVVVHEIGHLLGLGHSRVWEAIMFPRIPPRTRKVDLSNDDLQGIWGLYGRRL